MAAVASIAEGVASNLIAKTLELLAKEGLRKAASWWGARADLHKLGETIKMIQARVRDAERCHEGENSDAIKLWLQRLRLVLYQADDLFDEVISLDLLKQQKTEKSMLMLRKVGILFTTKCGSLGYNRNLANEIKSIKKQLDAIKSDMADLNLSNSPAQEPPMARLMKERETISSVNTEDVIGREIDRDNIIELLLDPKKDGEQITVIPIVGFGGLGKTTLAQLVFNHERVKQHFDLIKWAYVPEKDDLVVIMKKVYESLTNKNSDNLSLEIIQQGIRVSIENKKYLLVLDDLWDEREVIKELLKPLKAGKHGSKVIVTTRSNVVAKHFGPIQAAYKLGTLTDEQSSTLFKKLAFGPEHEDDKAALSEIGEQIVKMCHRVPLLINIIGASLYDKHTREEWLQVRNDLSKAESAKNEKITTVLKLSYDYLSPNSKLCFAYCSLFPKGYEFEKDELVHLWMAQGYVELDKGEQYFTDLVARNLFQGPRVFFGSHVYTMHDLLHDLAKEVAGNESMMYERPDQIHDRLVHVNLNGSRCPPSLKDANILRSLLDSKFDANDVELYSEMKSLRVLSMMDLDGNEMLSNSIGRLIHLRYLKLESTDIKNLPDFLTRLVNLQTLNLEDCVNLEELPRDFSRLVNLRHVLLPLNELIDLPPGFGKLTSLRKLNRFIVGKGNGIDSLPASNLRGELEIEFCRWRRDAIEEARRTNLKNNQQLTSLTVDLDFRGEESTSAAAGEMKEMLGCLEFPPYLKDLEVMCYKEAEMPVGWFYRQGLSSLRNLSLTSIPKVKTLPQGIACLTTLQQLTLNYMENLAEIPEEIGNLSLLRHLWIQSCPKVKSLPPSILCLQKLQELYIISLENLTELPGEIGNGNLPLLHRLDIQYCPKLKSFPTSIQGLASLQTLVIRACPDLARTISPDGEDQHLIQHIPNLTISSELYDSF